MIRQLLPNVAEIDGPAALESFYLVSARRHLRADFVVSIDGAVEVGGRSKPLGGPADRDAFMAMRAVSDAVVVGAGTVRIERYGPVSLDDEVSKRRRARGQAPVPTLVIVSRRGLLNSADPVFAGGHRPLLVTTRAAAAQHRELSQLADVIECGEHDVDLREAVDRLAERGFERLCCEGGPSLLHSLLLEGLVDELCVTFSPLMAGPQRLRLSAGNPFIEPYRFRLAGLLEGDGFLLARFEGPSSPRPPGGEAAGTSDGR